MEQSNKNTEEFDSSSQTVVFNPVGEEKKKTAPPVSEPEQIYYEDDFEDDEEDNSSETNTILIVLVIILVVLSIAALIWGTSVLNKMNKKEEINSLPAETQDYSASEEEEEFFEEDAEEAEGEKIICKIFFKSETVEEEDGYYTIRAIFKDENDKYYTERLTVDSETKIKEDGDSLLYKSFVNNVIKKLGNNEVEFDGVVDKETKHVDSISYKSEILETGEEGIVLEDEEEIL